ncbi:hypothetical protein QF039_001738 [Pseudomonas sp. W2I6]|nr:hypothetical protein [Pseudomonas sp. W2I6]
MPVAEGRARWPADRQRVGRRVQATHFDFQLGRYPAQVLEAAFGQPADLHQAAAVPWTVGHMHQFQRAEDQCLGRTGHCIVDLGGGQLRQLQAGQQAVPWMQKTLRLGIRPLRQAALALLADLPGAVQPGELHLALGGEFIQRRQADAQTLHTPTRDQITWG